MNREQFLRNLRQSRAKLVPVQIDGWEHPIFVRQQTVGEIKEILIERGEGQQPDAKSSLKDDPLYLARSIARIVRDQKGELLFDAKDDAQMRQLADTLDETAPDVSRRIHDEWNKLNAPTAEEVNAKGN